MRQGSIFWGIVCVVIGLVILLDNLGFFPGVSSWALIGSLLLILVGLSVLWAALMGPRQAPMQPVSIPRGTAGRARIKMHHGAGQLRIQAGTEQGELLAGRFGVGVQQTTRLEGDTLRVDLRMPTGVFPFSIVPWQWSRSILAWDVHLSPDVPLELEIHSGASESHLNLTDLRVTDLRLETGASDNQLMLPRAAGYTRARLKSGAAHLSVRVPQNVAASIRVKSGLSGVNVDTTRFPIIEPDVYRSPHFDTAPHRVEIEAETGVGSLEIR